MLAALALTTYVLVLSWSSAFFLSLIVITEFFGMPLAISIAAAWGLWFRKKEAWWLSVAVDFVALAYLAWSGMGGSLPLKNLVFLTLPVALVCLLLPETRSFYLHE